MLDREDNDLEELIAATRRASRGVHRGDPSVDDDIAQETLLIALRADSHRWAPGELRVVAKRVASSLRRRDGRRREREAIYARDAHLDEEGDGAALEPGSLRALVARLDARSRELIERRYFDGHSLAEIAEHDGVPLAGVRTRHRRAIARLRGLVLEARAAEAPRERRRVFGPIALWRRVVARMTSVNLRPAVLGGLLVVTAAPVLVALADGDRRAAGPSLVAARPSSEPGAEVAPLGRPVGRSAVPSPGAPSNDAAAADDVASADRVEVVVRDGNGRVVGGASVLRVEDPADERGTEVGRTNRHGVVEVPMDDAWYYARSAETGASLMNRLRGGEPLDLRLRSSGLRLTGRVLDGLGRPASGARVAVQTATAPLVYVDRGGEWRRDPPEPTATTDARGEFTLACRPARIGQEVHVTAEDGFVAARIPEDGRLGDLRLAPLDPAPAPTLRLCTEGGEALAGGTVWFERPPFGVEDPLPAARGQSARHLTRRADADGRVALPTYLEPNTLVRAGYGGGSLRVAFRARLSALLADGGELVVPAARPAPPARIAGSAPEGSSVFLVSDELVRPVELDVHEDGSFDFDRVAPGRARLSGRAHDGAPLGCVELDVVSGESVGGLRLERAQQTELLVDVELPASDRSSSLRLRTPSGGIQFLKCAEHDDDARTYFGAGGFGRLLADEPGTYLLTWTNGESVAQQHVAVEGHEGSLSLRLVPERCEWVELQLAPGPAPGFATLEVYDESGRVVWCRQARASRQLRSARLPLLEETTGELRIVIVDEAGERWDYELDTSRL